MTRQYSVAVRDAKRQAHEDTVGGSPKLRLLTGSQPANCAAAETGTLVCEMDLPADWLDDPSNGISTKLGSWSGIASVSDTIGYYRIVDNGGSVCHEQGSAGQGGTEDLVLDNATPVAGQAITVTTYQVTEGNA